MYFVLFLLSIISVFVILSVCMVSQQKAYVVERLGKYHKTLFGGLNFIIPFIDKVRRRIDLREIPLDIPSQICITKDNTQVAVDGIIFIQVTNPELAVYGTTDYITAVSSLAQTSLRSVIGRMNLDETLEERASINTQVVNALNEAATTWGVKLLRYEIKDLSPPEAVLKSMQDQITAERDKRAKVIRSEAEKIEQINIAEGHAQALIKTSQAEKEALINRATGEAESIKLIADANKISIFEVGQAIESNGGIHAVNLKVSEQYIAAFSKIAKESNTLIIPSNISDISGTIGTIMKTIGHTK